MEQMQGVLKEGEISSAEVRGDSVSEKYQRYWHIWGEIVWERFGVCE